MSASVPLGLLEALPGFNAAYRWQFELRASCSSSRLVCCPLNRGDGLYETRVPQDEGPGP